VVVTVTDNTTTSPSAADLLSALRPAAPKSDLQSSFDDHLKQVATRSSDSKPRSGQKKDDEPTSSAAPATTASPSTSKPAAPKESSKPSDAKAEEPSEGLQHDDTQPSDQAADPAADPAKLAVIAVQASQAKTVLVNKKAAPAQGGVAKADKVADGKAKQPGAKNAAAANVKTAASNAAAQTGAQTAANVQAKTDSTATDPTATATTDTATPPTGDATTAVPVEKQTTPGESKAQTAAAHQGDAQQITQQAVNAAQTPEVKTPQPTATTTTPTAPATQSGEVVEGKNKGETKKDAQPTAHDVLQPTAAQMAVPVPPTTTAAPSTTTASKGDASVRGATDSVPVAAAGNPRAADPTPDTAPVAGPTVVADATAKPNSESGPTAQPVAQGGVSSGISDVERARLVQRVSRAMQTASEGEGTLRLRLSPPELGAVRMEVSIKDGVMSARFETETSAAKSALVESLPDLQSRLAEHDIKLEHFEVDLADRGGLGTPDPSGQQTGQQREASSGGPRFKPNQAMATAEPAATTTATATRIVTNDQLNVVV